MSLRLAIFAVLAAVSTAAFGSGVVPGSVAADAGNGTLLAVWTPAGASPAVLQTAVVDLREIEVIARGEIPSGGAAQDGAAVSFNGSTFLVAWMEGTDVLATRIGTDGVVLDPEPIVIARGARPQKPGLAWSGQSWIAGWSEPDSRIQLRRVSAAGAVIDEVPVVLPPLPPSGAFFPSYGEYSPQIDCNGAQCLVVAFADALSTCRIHCPNPQALGLWVVDPQLVPANREYGTGIESGWFTTFDVAWGREAWLVVWGEHFARRIGRNGESLDPSYYNKIWPPNWFEVANATVMANGEGWTIVRDSAGPWPLVLHETQVSEESTASPEVTALRVATGSSHPILVRGPEPWLVWTVTEMGRSEVAVARLADHVGPVLSFDLKVDRGGSFVRAAWSAPMEDPDFYDLEMSEPEPTGGIWWNLLARLPGSVRETTFPVPTDSTNQVRVVARWANGFALYSNLVPMTPARLRPASR